MEKIITKIILPLVIIVALIGLLIATILLIRLQKSESDNVTNCEIHTVDGSQHGTSYICANSNSTYIYNKNAIYDRTADKELISVKNLIYMAATDREIYYYLPDNQGSLYRLSLDNNRTELVFDECYVVGMRADSSHIFIEACEEKENDIIGKIEDYKYDLLVIGEDKEVVNLTDWAEKNEPSEADASYATYEYSGYKLTADKTLSKDKVQFAYVEKEDDDFSYSCLPYNVYAKIGKDIVRIEKYPEKIAETEDEKGGKGGISPLMTGVYDDSIYSVVQYSRGHWGYKENPSVDFKVSDTYYKYDPQEEKWSLLYEAEKDEQIVGFSVERNKIYLLRPSGVYEHDLKTQKEKLIVKDPFSDEEYGTLYFENYDGKLYIFSESIPSFLVENIG